MSLITLEGKRGLVVGIANESSIAYGCAKAFRALGAELAVTYLNAKAERHVKPLADELEASLFLPLDVRNEGELEAVFAAIQEKWGKIDFVLHSIAFAPKEDLHARVVDSSQEGFLLAMDVSCHSFVRMAKLAEPLMTDGGCLQTVTFYGGEKVVEHYNLMGPVKAALESVTRYMAAELGEKGIRVHALSPGPLGDPRRFRHRPVRRTDDPRRRACADSSSRHDRGCRRLRGLPGFRRREVTDGFHRFHRWRLQHRRLMLLAHYFPSLHSGARGNS